MESLLLKETLPPEIKRTRELTASQLKTISDMITMTANAMGSDVSSSLTVMTADIGKLQVTREQLAHALYRCRTEIRGTGGFAPRLTTPDIMERMGIVVGDEADKLDAVAAWDLVVEVAQKHAKHRDGSWSLRPLVSAPKIDCADCSGSGITFREKEVDTIQGKRPERLASICQCKIALAVPDISDRVRDTVRRMGGWGTFVEIDKHHFVKKEFMLEFTRWSKVEERHALISSGERTRGLGSGLTRAKLSLPEIK
jgi:hypothetical protein